MLSGIRASTAWGLAASAAVHGVLWAWLSSSPPPRAAVDGQPGRVIVVRLPAAAAPLPAPDPAAPGAPALPPLLAPEVILPSEAERAAVRYYAQDELDRGVRVVHDGTAGTDLDAPPGVILHLFVDAAGKVSQVEFDGPPLTRALEQRLRAAFMTMEFMPGIKNGDPVPSRIRIVLQEPPPAE